MADEYKASDFYTYDALVDLQAHANIDPTGKATEKAEIIKKAKSLFYLTSYYSSGQVRFYIPTKSGLIWLDDVVSLDFELTNTKMPIYGYCSISPDGYLKGQVLCTGSITIAYTGENNVFQRCLNEKITGGDLSDIKFNMNYQQKLKRMLETGSDPMTQSQAGKSNQNATKPLFYTNPSYIDNGGLMGLPQEVNYVYGRTDAIIRMAGAILAVFPLTSLLGGKIAFTGLSDGGVIKKFLLTFIELSLIGLGLALIDQEANDRSPLTQNSEVAYQNLSTYRAEINDKYNLNITDEQIAAALNKIKEEAKDKNFKRPTKEEVYSRILAIIDGNKDKNADSSLASYKPTRSGKVDQIETDKDRPSNKREMGNMYAQDFEEAGLTYARADEAVSDASGSEKDPKQREDKEKKDDPNRPQPTEPGDAENNYQDAGYISDMATGNLKPNMLRKPVQIPMAYSSLAAANKMNDEAADLKSTYTDTIGDTMNSYIENIVKNGSRLERSRPDSMDYNILNGKYKGSNDLVIRPGFSIYIAYGSESVTDFAPYTIHILHDIHIMSIEQIVENNGIPIVERYSFFCRTMDHTFDDTLDIADFLYKSKETKDTRFNLHRAMSSLPADY